MTATSLKPVVEGTTKIESHSETATLIHMIERMVRDVSIDVDKLDRLLATYERMKAREAENAFNDAMTRAQAEMEPVKKDASNPQTHSKYATYAAMDRAVRPIYSKYGFALSFNTAPPRSGREMDIGVVCYATGHGHTRLYDIDMPVDGKGAKGNDIMTRTHATNSGVTYGMRGLLRMIFNIATEDDDGNAAGHREQQAKKPPAPPKPTQTEADPYIIPATKGMDPAVWAALYIAAVEKTETGDQVAALEKANTKVLGGLHARHHSIYQTIEAAWSKRRSDFGLRAEFKPTDTNQPKKPPAPTETPHDADGVVIPTDDPEAFRSWADGILAEATADNLESIFNEKIEIHLDKLFPPDADDIRNTLYRKHERRVQP